MSDLTATAIGALAIVLWGSLALFTVWTEGVPPLQLLAMTFAIAFLLACGKWLARGENGFVFLRQSHFVLGFGVAGLFGYHFFYFLALKNAPPVEAGLIAYLWPLLIVVFAMALPGEAFGWRPIIGALIGLAGCVVLVTADQGASFSGDYLLGYGAAAACALTWSSYSVLSRRLRAVPTDTVGWYCAATAVLGGVGHLIFEETVMPSSAMAWIAILALGLGPVGAAFFAWDIGMKHGHIGVLGAASYGAPLISTLLLIAFGGGQASWPVAVGCAAIVAGSVLAAWGKIGLARSRPAAPQQDRNLGKDGE
ncbi:MAG: EamA family transporter [Alphaproteobacteria bacterium]|nr:EamA family transporter [Alphaproteobacteria bacterium]